MPGWDDLLGRLKVPKVKGGRVVINVGLSRVAHKRAVNAARARRYRMRKRLAHVG